MTTRSARLDEPLADPAAEAGRRAQLLSYAEDMRQLINEHTQLQWRYHLLEEAHVSLGGSHPAIDRLADCLYDMYLVTDAEGLVQCVSQRVLDKFTDPVPFGMPLQTLLESGRGATDTAPPGCIGESAHCLNRCTVPCRLRVLEIPPRGEGAAAAIHWFIRDIPKRNRPSGCPQTLSSASEIKPDGLLIYDPNGTILAANRAFQSLTGYSADGLIGQSIASLRSEFQPCLDDPQGNCAISLSPLGEG